jgi:hypothetical protein
VRGRAAAWLLSLPVALAGSAAAHALAYQLVEPDAHERAHLLAASGHGYLGQLRVLAAAAVALALAGFVRQAALAAHGREAAGPPLVVALVPPLAFVLQEHLERALHGGAFPLGAVLEPTFLVGLALQLPFALLALGLAWLLVRTAAAVGRLLATPPRVRARPRQRPPSASLLPPAARSFATAARAPPAPARP